MADKIEIYVKTQKQLIGQHHSVPVSDGVMIHSCLSKKMLEYEKTLPEQEKRVVDLVNNFADKRGLIIEIVDVSTYKGKLRAAMKGIGKTPTVLAGQERIETQRGLQQLESLLESHFKNASAWKNHARSSRRWK